MKLPLKQEISADYAKSIALVGNNAIRCLSRGFTLLVPETHTLNDRRQGPKACVVHLHLTRVLHAKQPSTLYVRRGLSVL
jgi:hypothetical protein